MTTAKTIALERSLTQADFDSFAELSGDDNPIHVDREFAAQTRFGRTVAHGMLLSTVLRGLLDELLPGAVQVSQKLVFPAPTYAGEPMRFSAEVTARDDDRVLVAIRCARLSDDQLTCEGETTMRVRRKA